MTLLQGLAMHQSNHLLAGYMGSILVHQRAHLIMEAVPRFAGRTLHCANSTCIRMSVKLIAPNLQKCYPQCGISGFWPAEFGVQE